MVVRVVERVEGVCVVALARLRREVVLGLYAVLPALREGEYVPV